MRFLLAVAIATISFSAGCVRAPAQPVDPNACNCNLRQNDPNANKAYYPYSGQ